MHLYFTIVLSPYGLSTFSLPKPLKSPSLMNEVYICFSFSTVCSQILSHPEHVSLLAQAQNSLMIARPAESYASISLIPLFMTYVCDSPRAVFYDHCHGTIVSVFPPSPASWPLLAANSIAQSYFVSISHVAQVHDSFMAFFCSTAYNLVKIESTPLEAQTLNGFPGSLCYYWHLECKLWSQV